MRRWRVSADEARALALSFEGAAEQDHHGRPSFRVNGKIFATLWTGEQLNVMLPGDRIEQVAADEPERCEPVHWGKRLAAIRVDLPLADLRPVHGLVCRSSKRCLPKPGSAAPSGSVQIGLCSPSRRRRGPPTLRRRRRSAYSA